MGREVYRKREKRRGRKAGLPKRWEGRNRKTQYCVILYKQRRAKRLEPTKSGRELGLKGT